MSMSNTEKTIKDIRRNTQVQQPMIGVESPGNCAIAPRIRPLWSQGR